MLGEQVRLPYSLLYGLLTDFFSYVRDVSIDYLTDASYSSGVLQGLLIFECIEIESHRYIFTYCVMLILHNKTKNYDL